MHKRLSLLYGRSPQGVAHRIALGCGGDDEDIIIHILNMRFVYMRNFCVRQTDVVAKFVNQLYLHRSMCVTFTCGVWVRVHDNAFRH